jgi:two-component system response regulator PilR (NtrC family)
MKKSILVIDDEKDLREILKKILSAEGYDVTIVADGEAALGKFKEKLFDLIVTDLRMPGLKGIDMPSSIERIHPQVKVVIVTGYPLDAEIQRKVDSEKYAYFAKPFDNIILVEKIKELLVNQR